MLTGTSEYYTAVRGIVGSVGIFHWSDLPSHRSGRTDSDDIYTVVVLLVSIDYVSCAKTKIQNTTVVIINY